MRPWLEVCFLVFHSEFNVHVFGSVSHVGRKEGIQIQQNEMEKKMRPAHGTAEQHIPENQALVEESRGKKKLELYYHSSLEYLVREVFCGSL